MIIRTIPLIVFIKPYYRNDRINTIDSISGTMESLLLKDNVSKADVESASRTILGNNVCALILNEAGNSVYSPPDSLGQLCLLDKEITIGDMAFTIKDDPKYLIDSIKRENPYSLTLDSPYADVEMLIYGKQIKSTLSNYYLIISLDLTKRLQNILSSL